MLWNLDLAWLLMTVSVVAVLSYFFGTALDALMREDGFGPLGNTIIFVAGFFGGILAANCQGVSLRNLTLAAAVGLGGAFATLATLAVLKAGITRMSR